MRLKSLVSFSQNIYYSSRSSEMIKRWVPIRCLAGPDLPNHIYFRKHYIVSDAASSFAQTGHAGDTYVHKPDRRRPHLICNVRPPPRHTQKTIGFHPKNPNSALRPKSCRVKLAQERAGKTPHLSFIWETFFMQLTSSESLRPPVLVSTSVSNTLVSMQNSIAALR